MSSGKRRIFTLKNKRHMPKWLAFLAACLVRLWTWTLRVEVVDPHGFLDPDRTGGRIAPEKLRRHAAQTRNHVFESVRQRMRRDMSHHDAVFRRSEILGPDYCFEPFALLLQQGVKFVQTGITLETVFGIFR